MKMRINLLTIITFFSLTLYSQYSDDLTKEIRELDDFTTLIASRGINVTFVQGLQTKAEIHITNSSPDNVIIEQKDENLIIRMRANNDRDVSVNVFLSAGLNQIEKINIGTGARVYSETILKSKKLEVEIGAGSVAELNIDVEEVNLNISSSSAQFLGKANLLNIKATVGANVETTDLEVNEANVSANLGSNVVLCVKNKIVAKSYTGARIAYCGSPKIEETNQSLGGKVEQF